MIPKERLIAILNAATVFFLLLAVLLRPLVCGRSGGLATNILVTLPLVAAVFLWIMGMVMRQEVRLCRTPLDLPVFFLVVFALASVGTAAYKHAAASVAFDWLCYVALFYLVLNLCAETPRLAGAVLAATLASTFIVSLNGLLQHLYSLDLTRDLFLKNQESWIVTLGLPPDAASDFVGRLATGRVFSTFLLPNTCAGFLGVVIPLQVGFVIHAFVRREAGRRGWIAVAASAVAVVASLLCLYYTKSKGGWISLALVAAAFAAVSGRRILAQYWKWFLAAVAGVVLVFAVLQLTHRAPPAGEYIESFSVRTQYWRAGALLIRDHPLFGVGLNNFGEYYPQYRRPQDDETLMVHNNFIQVWAETGVFGFLAFCAVWAAFFLAMRRQGKPATTPEKAVDAQEGEQRLLAGLACLVGFAMIYVMFNSFEPLPVSAPWLLTGCFGLAWACVYFLIEGNIEPAQGAVRAAIACGVAFFLIHSLVDFDLYEQGVAQTVWLLMAVGIAPVGCVRRVRLGSLGQLVVAAPVIAVTAIVLCWVYPCFLDAKVHLENARELSALKEDQKAVAEWLAAARLDPWDAEPQMMLAQVFLVQRNKGVKEYEGRPTLELSLEHIQRAIQLNPRGARYHHFLAGLYETMSREATSPQRAEALRKAALAELEAAHKLFPSRATYAGDLAFAYDEMGRHAEALALYAQALELDSVSRPERFTTKLSPETRREIERRLRKAQKEQRRTP